MTTAAVASYPQLVARETVSLGEIVKVGDFEIMAPTVPATNMASNGVKEKIFGGLREATDVVITLNYTSGSLDTLLGDQAAGTVSDYTITYNNTEVGTFTALVGKVTVLGTEADNPSKPQQAEITLEITGAFTLT